MFTNFRIDHGIIEKCLEFFRNLRKRFKIFKNSQNTLWPIHPLDVYMQYDVGNGPQKALHQRSKIQVSKVTSIKV